MARIRTYKPEFWTSEQVVECSPIARLLFLGMLTFCDDAGIHPASLKRLKMEVFPADEFSDDDIAKMVDELLSAGLIKQYVVEGKRFWIVTGWHHQKIDKPTYKHPSPKKATKFDEPSTNGSRMVDEASPPEGEWTCKGKGKQEHPSDVCGEQAQEPDSPPANPGTPSEFSFPVTGKGPKSWNLPAWKLADYQRAYPDLDVPREMNQARQWILANPKRKKTSGGMLAFLTGWLNRAQNRGGTSRASPSAQEVPKTQLKSAAELLSDPNYD